MIVGYPVPGAT